MKQFRRQENAKIQPGANRESKGVSLSSRSTVSLQPELEMTQPGDAYEQEADKMADRILDHAFAAASPTPYASRPVISRAPSGYASVSVPPSVEAAISSSRGSGFPMPSALKARMESGFGADFSQVRFHTDSSAAQMSSSIRANAFTSGSDVYFASGKYDPSSRSGQHLIAHELTHTLQQSGKVARDPYDGPPAEIALPLIVPAPERIDRENKEKANRKNKCELFLYYLLMHDPDIVEKGLSEEDARKVCRLFPESINNADFFGTRRGKLEELLNEEKVKSVSTEWLTKLLSDQYDIFRADYESALERAMTTLADRQVFAYYAKHIRPEAASIKKDIFKTVPNRHRSNICGWLLSETEKEDYAPAPYRRFLAEQQEAFSKLPLENSMSMNAANEQRRKEKQLEDEKRERQKKEKEKRENQEYFAFLAYLTMRFFPTGQEEYRDENNKRVITLKNLDESFGFGEDGFDAEKRDTKKILELWESMMSVLSGKKKVDLGNGQEVARALQAVWDEAKVEEDERFEGFERFVEYEKQLVEYKKDKNIHVADYLVMPDNFVSAETYTEIFFTIMTTALSFIPVGAFAGMGECVAKAAHFFSTKVIPRLIKVAVNESYGNAASNDAGMDFLTNALDIGLEAFFGKLPVACNSKVGQLIADASKDSLQSIASDSSGYLVKYMYGEDTDDWAMVTTKNAMTSFAKSLGVGVFKEAQKKIAFSKEAEEAGKAADQADKHLKEKEFSKFDAEMARVDGINAGIDVSNDFLVQVEGEAVGVVDNAFGISDAIEKKLSSKDAVSPVMVVPVYELITIDQLSFPNRHI